MNDALTVLKIRLLLQALDRVPNTELHALVINEAEAASLMAVRTGFAALVFPCLFTERVTGALELEARRKRKYWAPTRELDKSSAEVCPDSA